MTCVEWSYDPTWRAVIFRMSLLSPDGRSSDGLSKDLYRNSFNYYFWKKEEQRISLPRLYSSALTCKSNTYRGPGESRSLLGRKSNIQQWLCMWGMQGPSQIDSGENPSANLHLAVAVLGFIIATVKGTWGKTQTRATFQSLLRNAAYQNTTTQDCTWSSRSIPDFLTG